jgi:hypothetical protein
MNYFNSNLPPGHGISMPTASQDAYSESDYNNNGVPRTAAFTGPNSGTISEGDLNPLIVSSLGRAQNQSTSLNPGQNVDINIITSDSAVRAAEIRGLATAAGSYPTGNSQSDNAALAAASPAALTNTQHSFNPATGQWTSRPLSQQEANELSPICPPK